MAEPIFETERLRMRLPEPGDVDAFMTHLNTPAIMRWLGPVQTREEMIRGFERIEACHARYGHCFWIMERKTDGTALGFCGLKRVDADGTDLTGNFEIGWRLREDVWGKGYAREAAAASLDRAFHVHDARLVIAFTIIENSASWGLMERLGMIRRPELDYDDPRYSADLNPTIVYSIARDQWTA